MTVHSIPFLLERGYGPGFAAFAVGLVGVSQIPGRCCSGPRRAGCRAEWATALVFALIALGIALIAGVDSTSTVIAGLVVLGIGSGMATLARATAVADLYGPAAYGTIAGVAALMTTGARAAGPVAGAIYAVAFGYDALFWTLAGLSAVAAGLAYRSQAASSSSASGRT